MPTVNLEYSPHPGTVKKNNSVEKGRNQCMVNKFEAQIFFSYLFLSIVFIKDLSFNLILCKQSINEETENKYPFIS